MEPVPFHLRSQLHRRRAPSDRGAQAEPLVLCLLEPECRQLARRLRARTRSRRACGEQNARRRSTCERGQVRGPPARQCDGLAQWLRPAQQERPARVEVLWLPTWRLGVRLQPNVELCGRRRQDTRPGLETMYRVAPDWAWWPAIGAPLARRSGSHLIAFLSQYAMARHPRPRAQFDERPGTCLHVADTFELDGAGDHVLHSPPIGYPIGRHPSTPWGRARGSNAIATVLQARSRALGST